ncbi:hypothetical protein B0T21DRAFT_415357 [Apiosordaria backusii]|uniref:Uncharacterized protein n=1 Tax=Apiosordaria backusii TaxID=314023 RepID=A0AA40DYW5_9PEZI|nr:hypothetical protein B0T21DRAFT_415357 [Apiosordaria backusii]
MGRKRDFNSSPDSPETPVRANNDSELELSQSPAAKRAKRSGRPSTASSIIPIPPQFGTPSSAAGTGKKKEKKKKNKRVKVSHEEENDVDKGEENVYDDDVPEETFTPAGVPRSVGTVLGSRTRGLSVIQPSTPFSERIARIKEERKEKGKGKRKSLGGGAVKGKDGGPGISTNGGDNGGIGKSVDGTADADAMDVDTIVTTDNKAKGKEVEMATLDGDKPSVKKSKKKNKDDGSAAGQKKKKRKSSTWNEYEGHRQLTGRELEVMFPALPRPAAPPTAAATNEREEAAQTAVADDDDDEVGNRTSDEIEEQITRELTASTSATGNTSQNTPAPMDLDTNLDFAFHEDDEADDGGDDEEIKGLIEEIFERPDFEYPVDGETAPGGDEVAGAVVPGVMDGLDWRGDRGTLPNAAADDDDDASGNRESNNGDAPGTGNNNDDMKTIKALLQSLEAKIDALPSDGQGQQQDKMKSLTKELREVFNGVVTLSGRVHRDEMRAAVRHEILFNGMKKIAGELGVVRRQGEAVMNHLGLKAESPQGVHKKWEEKDKNREGRKALENCLRFHLEDMGRAKGKEQVEEKGRLAVEYAGKVLGGL